MNKINKKRLKLIGISNRRCPKCGSYKFWWKTTTIGESYEICEVCGYAEKDREPKKYRKVGNEPFGMNNYVKDPEGKWHNHGKYGWHKVSVKHRRVEGELYSFEEL